MFLRIDSLSIVDDVTNHSISSSEEVKIAAPGTVRCKFWGLGSDGTVGANKIGRASCRERVSSPV